MILFWISPKQYSCLPSLKKLHFARVKFKNHENSLKNLVSGCPVLKELYLENIRGRWFYHSIKQEWFVLSPSLKILRLIYIRSSYFVEAPKLEYLQLVDDDGCVKRFSMARPSPSLDIGKLCNPVPVPTSFVAELFQGISVPVFENSNYPLEKQECVMILSLLIYSSSSI